MFVQRIKFYRNIQYYVILSIVAAVAPALYGGQNNKKTKRSVLWNMSLKISNTLKTPSNHI